MWLRRRENKEQWGDTLPTFTLTPNPRDFTFSKMLGCTYFQWLLWIKSQNVMCASPRDYWCHVVKLVMHILIMQLWTLSLHTCHKNSVCVSCDVHVSNKTMNGEWSSFLTLSPGIWNLHFYILMAGCDDEELSFRRTDGRTHSHTDK